MKKLNEYTGSFVNVSDVSVIFRTCDNIAYGVYKDINNMYYIDAYDGAPSISELGTFNNDDLAINSAKLVINNI